MGLAFPETDRVAFSSERAREAQACVREIRGAIAPDENLQRQMKACRRKQLLLWDFIWASVWKMSRMAWTCFFLMRLMKMHFRWSLWSLNLHLGALKPCSSDSAASPVMTVRNTAGASVSDGETLSAVGHVKGKSRGGLVSSAALLWITLTFTALLQIIHSSFTQHYWPPVKERDFIRHENQDFLDHWFSEEHQQILFWSSVYISRWMMLFWFNIHLSQMWKYQLIAINCWKRPTKFGGFFLNAALRIFHS